MSRDHYEPNRFLGLPVGRSPYARPGEEPQRMMGIPADWLGPPARTSGSGSRPWRILSGRTGAGYGGAVWVLTRRTKTTQAEKLILALRLQCSELSASP